MIGSFGGFTLAVLEILLLWKDVQKIVRRKATSSFTMFLRLLLSGTVILVFLRFFHGDIMLFILSFSVVYFSLVIWLGMDWRDRNGRNI
ncbi:MAG: hypothetical protein ABDK94_05175 [Atribacterota bacterium]